MPAARWRSTAAATVAAAAVATAATATWSVITAATMVTTTTTVTVTTTTHHHHHRHHRHHHHFHHRHCHFHRHGFHFHRHCHGHVRWYGWRHYYPVASYAVAPRPVASTCTCLVKEYLPNGAVLFRDVCTNELAMNPPAQAAEVPPQGS